MNSNKEFFWWDGDAPWSTKVPNFMTNQSLMAICWQGLHMYCSVYREEPQTKLSVSCTVPYVFMPSEPATTGKVWFPFVFYPQDEDLPRPNCILFCLYTDQSERHDLDTALTSNRARQELSLWRDRLTVPPCPPSCTDLSAISRGPGQGSFTGLPKPCYVPGGKITSLFRR